MKEASLRIFLLIGLVVEYYFECHLAESFLTSIETIRFSNSEPLDLVFTRCSLFFKEDNAIPKNEIVLTKKNQCNCLC